MLAEAKSSQVDDEVAAVNTGQADSYHGSLQVSEAVQRRVTMDVGEMTADADSRGNSQWACRAAAGGGGRCRRWSRC